ncbi:MAG: sulfatase family protein [Akkermansiaceae bacterium]
MKTLLFFLTSLSLWAEKPNIVLIMADDIGLGDLSFHVRTQQKKDPVIETPHLDALARESLWFTDGHSATALCSPTRYCVMSGNNNYRSYAPWGVWSTFRESAFKKGEATIGTVARDAGYHTGFIGKWHLGGDFKAADSDQIYRGAKGGDIGSKVDLTKMLGGGPRDCGFTYDFTLPCGVQGPIYTAYENQEWYPLHQDSKIIFLSKKTARFPKDVSDKGPGPGDSHWNASELGKLVSQKASDFIQSAPEDKPFFLYYCTHAVHIPHCPPEKFDDQKIKGATPSHHLDMVIELDLQVKRIVEALKAKGIFDNTLIVFTSDNGGLLVDRNTKKAGHDVAGGFNGSKNSPLEGGHRVPFFFHWKGHIKPGITDEPAINQDMLATLATLVGTKVPADQARDSLNLLPLLTGKGEFKQRPWIVQQAGSRKEILYRKAPWKLIIQSNHKLDSFEPKALYNLENDPEEKKNLIAVWAQKERVAEMLAAYLKILNTKERTAPLSD